MLVVEDRDEDICLFRVACERARLNLPFRTVKNGSEAIQYLKGEGQFANRAEYPLPRLMLLDLNMPLVNGFEVLEWLRTQPGLRRLIVIVFTSSARPEDVNRAFELGANSYLVKPMDLVELEGITRYLQEYWLKINHCPDCSPNPKREDRPAAAF